MAGEGKGSRGEIDHETGGAGDIARGANALVVTNLTSDQPKVAANLDDAMVNAWGIAAYREMFWIADAGTGKVSIVDGKGAPSTGKLASGKIDLGEGITGVAVTGLPADDKTSLQIRRAGARGPAQLIFASEGGKLYGINLELSTTSGFQLVDRSGVHASYKGVAVVRGAKGPMVLAADFHNARIDVFDASFEIARYVSFVVPKLPQGFAPFNVMAFDDTVYVAYAMQDADKADEVAGPGLGLLAAFDSSGKLLGTLQSDLFNAPWGMAMSRDFAAFPNALLIGNFGDGHITAVAPGRGRKMTVLGQLMGRTGAPVAVDGLWGLAFGPGVANARPDGLYFAAGPDEEMHGLFGVIARPGHRHRGDRHPGYDSATLAP
jgi:uncharacterized protein (TIGR03118 family)